MRITYRKTRLVLVLENRAIKIGRVRPLRFICRFAWLAVQNKKRRERFFLKYDPEHRGFWVTAYNYIFAGPLANRNEYQVYGRSCDSRFVPTIALRFYGLIAVQLRAEPVTATELTLENPFRDLSREQLMRADIFCLENFGRFGGSVRVLDYGSREFLRLVG